MTLFNKRKLHYEKWYVATMLEFPKDESISDKVQCN